MPGTPMAPEFVQKPEIPKSPHGAEASVGQTVSDESPAAIGISLGDRMTIVLLIAFFAILGFALLSDLVGGLFRWAWFFP